MQLAKNNIARPEEKRTYELVQICLFIGKLKSQTIPRHKQILPTKYIAMILSFKDLDLFNTLGAHKTFQKFQWQ